MRDAIWGDVTLGPPELAVIDTPPFQRLRRVKQLGFTDLVFPGAHHTRFEHSIGVMHVAGLALARLGALTGGGGIGPDDARAFRAAALLHDVGHYPFSHALEELEVSTIGRHEDHARTIVCGAPVADVLRSSWDADPARVAAFVAGPAPGDPPSTGPDALLRSVLDSSLDVDKLDYLVRDAAAANVPYGMVDVQRLVGSFTIWHDEDGAARLAVESKGVTALQSLVFAKHMMFATVYWHHTARAAVVMLLRAVQEALGSGALVPRSLEGADDAELMRMLLGDDMPERTRDMARRLRGRRLYKRALEIGIDHPSFGRLEELWFRPERRAATEDAWAERAGVPPGSVLLDVPEPRPIAVDLPVIVDGSEVSEWDRVSGLATDDLERFQRWVRKIRIFATDAPTASEVAGLANEILG